MHKDKAQKHQESALQYHPFGPVWDKNSKILILGSFPSVKSREDGFYYAHPQNRFWRLLENIYNETIPKDIPSRKAFLLKHSIALFDVIYKCEIKGSSDASIKSVQPQNLEPILKGSNINSVFCNGQTAGRLYKKYQLPITQLPAIVLPSTSAANAACSFDCLKKFWIKILEKTIS
ncbi:MAG: DNA-deoxyinosine glycosylase [Eubacteriales bacterium]|nr:DNA-deoxyinosine glycosylase [Eubacteriales bacterium]